MLSLTFSNYYEVLLAALLARLAEEKPGPFDQRHVIVPNPALRRSVELAVAQREGIAASLRFESLEGWLWREIDKVIPVGKRSPFAPAQLRWRIFDLLGGGWTKAHPRLARYLAGADALMRFELAERIACLFDNYITYRPQWLERWAARQRICGLSDSERSDEDWQAELWRRIRSRHSHLGLQGEHPANAYFDLLAAISPVALRQTLPNSLHVFCLPSMPPLYLDMVRRLSQWIDIRLYVLNPCREYWFEIVPPRYLTWLLGQQRDLYHESGNRLLAGWARQTQAHIDLLFEGEHGPVVEEGVFISAAASGRNSLLGQLQDAVLELVDPPPGGMTHTEDDRSVEVHVCHSLLREIEVLHDRLLALFADDPSLRLDDILVVAADLGRAAPLIEAVFGSAPLSRHLLWRITGQSQTRVNPVARVLDMALALQSSRFPVNGLFELLQQSPVAERLGLARNDLQRLRQWLLSAGVHWGLDGGQREALGLPYDQRHSLANGLHRLFLAYAAGEEDIVFSGRTAAGNPEGSEALLLGKLWRYADTLQRLYAECARPHGADGWRRILLAVLDALVPASTAYAEEVRSVHLAIEELHAAMTTGGAPAAVPLKVIHATLKTLLDDPLRGGVPGGAITFTAMNKLRNLPYRVICVIGLDDGVFPGSDCSAEFDLMVSRPLRGDRQRRYDERNQFLDLLLAARDCVHLSYSGRSARDNSEKPPSVVIDELLDYLARGCAADPRDPASLAATRRRLTVLHPLQPFSRDYYLQDDGRDPRLIGFHDDYRRGLQARLQHLRAADGLLPEARASDAATAAPFFTAPLPPPTEEWRQVELARLIRFFRQPSRYLLTERLGVDLSGSREMLDDSEPFIPDWLSRHQLAQRLLPALLADCSPDETEELALASEIYPSGTLGNHLLGHELSGLRRYAATLRAELTSSLLPPVTARVDTLLAGENWTLSAELTDLRPHGLVRYRYDDIRVGDLLSGWLTHLTLCAAAPAGVTPTTRWHARDGVYQWRPVDNAAALLDTLLALYRRGLCEPLRFFPKTAWAWIDGNRSPSKAQQKWHGGLHAEFGEANDPAVRLAFRGVTEPLDQTFYELAVQIFEPLCDHMTRPAQAYPTEAAAGASR